MASAADLGGKRLDYTVLESWRTEPVVSIIKSKPVDVVSPNLDGKGLFEWTRWVPVEFGLVDESVTADEVEPIERKAA